MAFSDVQLDRLGSLFVARPLLAAGVLRERPAIPILMYHSISDEPEEGVRPYYRLTTSPARFRQQMQWLRDNGFVVVDLSAALRLLADGSDVASRAVVVTFDDGFQDFLRHAFPVLADCRFTATMFLPTDYISDAPRRFKGRVCLTWSEVRTLRAEGVSFGSHTVSHPVLSRLPWDDVRRELRDSKLRIEQQLQAPVDTFAYPYAFPQENAAFVTRFRRELVDQGYSAAVTTIIGRAVAAELDSLCLKRLPINECDDPAVFISKVRGAYDWVGGVQAVFRMARRLPMLRSA